MTEDNPGAGAGDVQKAHLRFLETLDCVNRDIHGSSTREQMLRDVLETVLGIFGCDRAFLIYPCQTGAGSWRLVMEAYKPEFASVHALGAEVPLDPEVGENFRALLAADGPLTFGPGGDRPLNEEFLQRVKIRSMLAAAIYPGGEKPYMFGVQQCSGPRVWTRDEKALVAEVGRRLADGMTSMAAYLALRENEAKYRRILDTANEGVLVLDASGKVTFLNARLAALLGCRAEEAMDRQFGDFLFPEDVKDHALMVENRRRGVSERYERRLRSGDGRTVWALISAAPMQDEKGGFCGSFAMFTDITDRKLAEEAQRRLNRELRAISNCNQFLMRAGDERGLLDEICRIIRKEAGYGIAWVGYVEHDEASTVRLVACSGGDCTGVTGAKFSWAGPGSGPVGEAVRSGEAVIVQDFLADQRASALAGDALWRGFLSGIFLPLKDARGTVFGVLGVYSADPGVFTPEETRLMTELAGDLAFGITVLRARAEHGRAEEALRISEEKFQMAFKLAPVMISLSDVPDGKLLDVNDKYCSVHGMGREEILGHTPVELGHLLPECEWKIRTALKRFGRVENMEVKAAGRDGGTRFYSYSGAKLDSGGRSMILGIVDDITESKETAEKINASLAEKEVLLKEIHHRVKNNLQVVSSLLNLQARTVKDAAALAALAESRARVKAMALVHEVLYRSQDLARMDMREYVGRLVDSLQESFRGDGRVKVEREICDCGLSIDTAVSLGLILNEVVTNSLKHAFPDGRTGRVDIRLRSSGGMFVLTVEDDGVGLPDGFDRARSATLGMQLVYLLAKQIAGEVVIKPGPGARLELRFPG